jgi:hypothetical protein
VPVLLPRIEKAVITDEQIRAICGMALTPRPDPEVQDAFIFALRAACAQYLRERPVFSAYPKLSPLRVQKRETERVA